MRAAAVERTARIAVRQAQACRLRRDAFGHDHDELGSATPAALVGVCPVGACNGGMAGAYEVGGVVDRECQYANPHVYQFNLP